jgi:hypothetical protein
MSYIRKLKSGKWQVCVRRKNYPTITKTFNEKSLASQYGRDIESKMDRSVFEDYTAAATTTLGQILTRYRDEITTKKKGYREETPKINLLLRHQISSYNLMQLKSSHLYELKNEMLKTKAPKTVNDYLHLISHTWKTAKRVWNMSLPHQNPVELVQLEKVNNKRDITKTICSGAIANESLFAIILYSYRQLDLKGSVISAVTHLTDWTRMTSATSPHIFKEANDRDIKFIDSELNKNTYAMFIRKVAPEFPNQILKQYIYEKYMEEDNKLVLKEPNIFIYNKIKRNVYYYSPYMVIVIISYFLYSYLYLI